MTLTGLTRRTFLAGAGTLAAVSAIGLPASATTPALDPYAAQTWEPLVGSSLPVGSLQARLANLRLQTNGFQLVFESAEIGRAACRESVF